MTLTLYLADVGAGKMQFAQTRILDLKAEDRLAKIWVLLATERQIHAFRSRLITAANRRVLFNIEFFSFYELYARLLAAGGIPQRSLDDPARRALIRAILAEHAGESFHAIATKPGFTRVISNLIYELKQNLIEPERFLYEDAPPKIRQLGHIYEAYQTLLREKDLVDREGEGWQALAALGDQPALASDVRLLLVDGYDQFSVLQAQLLTRLGQRIGETIVTLTRAEGREHLIGKRFQQARTRLQQAHEAVQETMPEEHLVQQSDVRQEALRHLTANFMRPNNVSAASTLLEGEEERVTAVDTWLQPGIHLIEAPDPASEVGAVLRRVKALLLNGLRPEDFLIALRDWATYAPHFRAQSRQYALPIVVDGGEPLIENAAINFLLHLLDLYRSDFRRRDILDALRSPYFPADRLTSDDVTALERISADHRIIGGREAWLNGLRKVIYELTASERDDLLMRESDESDPTTPQYSVEHIMALTDTLYALFEGITPPETGSIADYVAWLENLIGNDGEDIEDKTGTLQDDLAAPPMNEHEALTELPETGAITLHLFSQIRANAPDANITRDLEAMRQLKRALRGMIAASALTQALGYAQSLTRETFLTELRAAISAASMNISAGRDGYVLVTNTSDGRGLPHNTLFLVGLSEGIFPAPAAEDPLLLDSERLKLREHGIDLPSQSERADDLGIFYELISQSDERLILSRPTVKDGALWVESPLWRSTTALFTNLPTQTIKLGAALPADQACTTGETALALADQPDSPQTSWFVNTHSALAGRIVRGWESEMARVRRQASTYNGRLNQPSLFEFMQAHLGEEYAWSASQLNDLGMCAFKFFAGRLLKIEKLGEIEEGLDALTLGNLYHKILEDTYNNLQTANIPINAENAAQADAILTEQAEIVLSRAAQLFDFLPSPLWEKEQTAIRSRLKALVQTDFSDSLGIPQQMGIHRQPYRQEWAFGTVRPMTLALDEGLTIRLRGKIDRVDLSGDGSTALVIDYKTSESSIPKPNAYERGRNFQMMIYLLAARQLLPQKAIVGAFISIGTQKSKNVTWLDALPAETAKGTALDPQIGRKQLAENIRQAQSGDFTAEANGIEGGRCYQHCDFVHLCRMGVMDRRTAVRQ
jgi:ATP-dependent helicase/DNAse subunit B